MKTVNIMIEGGTVEKAFVSGIETNRPMLIVYDYDVDWTQAENLDSDDEGRYCYKYEIPIE